MNIFSSSFDYDIFSSSFDNDIFSSSFDNDIFYDGELMNGDVGGAPLVFTNP